MFSSSLKKMVVWTGMFSCLLWIVGCGGASGGTPKYATKKRPASTESQDSATENSSKDSGKKAASANQKADGWGTLKGTITLAGDIPTLPAVTIEKDVEVCKEHASVNETLLVNSGNRGIKNVFVYLGKKPDEVHPDLVEASDAVVDFDQKNCVFLTHAVAMHVDQDLNLLNSDPVSHNTRIQGGSSGEANPLLPAGADPQKFKFNRKTRNPVPISCNIHPWMKSYVLAQDHPYFAVTDENGAFEIPNLPSGIALDLRVWHEASGLVDSAGGEVVKGKWSVTLEADATQEESFDIDVSSLDVE